MTPHSQRLERWIGAEQVAHLSSSMRNWYGPPIALGGVPGNVMVTGGGDFIGRYTGPAETEAYGRGEEVLKSVIRQRFQHKFWKQRGAFSGLSALIAAKTGGKSCTMIFSKSGTASTATLGVMDLWTTANTPAAGSAGGAAPTGTSPTNSTTGSLKFVNAVSNANTSHFVNAALTASVAGNSLMMYDRLFSVAKTMNSTATEAVSGTFSRYQSSTNTALDYAGGNFCFPSSPTTVLAATGHNWTVCQYTSEAGTTGQSFSTTAGISACAVHQVDLVLGSWFLPLVAGDVGVKALSQMQCSALVATGTIDFVVGHPIAMFPCPVANLVMNIDGVTSAFNLAQVYNNAALAFMELPKPATTATTYSGLITTVSE